MVVIYSKNAASFSGSAYNCSSCPPLPIPAYF
jgi:hypothetical protein